MKLAMNSEVILGTLNRLLAIHCQSVPIYLSYTSPWANQANGDTQDVLNDLVADQRLVIDRIARLIDRLGGNPDRGHRRDLTPLNDLSLDFLLHRVIQYQKEDIAEIESCVERLRDDAEAQALAQEALGMAKGHLESLEEVARELAGAKGSDG